MKTEHPFQPAFASPVRFRPLPPEEMAKPFDQRATATPWPAGEGPNSQVRSVQTTPGGLRVTFADGFQLLLGRDDPDAEIFRSAANKASGA